MEEQQIKQMIDQAIMLHEHNGNLSRQIELDNIFGTFKTIDNADDLTNTLAETPRNLHEQIFIHYNSTGPVTRLYIYDNVTSEWGYTALTIV